MKAHLPVSCSFGFSAYLQEVTSGQAFPTLNFSHWKDVPGDVLDDTSKAYKLVMDIRKRKGLKAEMPSLNSFLDKL